MRMTGIYKITSPTGKIYIGQSRQCGIRFTRYKNKNCKRQPKIYSSLNKYGPESHKYEIICHLPNDVSNEILNSYEELYIRAYKDCGFELLNLTGGGHKNQELSDDTRDKLRKAATGKKYWLGRRHSEEAKEKIRIGNTGKVFTKERLKKMSESQKGKAGISFGTKRTEEQKKRIGDASRGRQIISHSGEKNEKSKLKERDVIEIRRLFNSGLYSQAEIGKMYHMSQTGIGLIVRGINWKYLK